MSETENGRRKHNWKKSEAKDKRVAHSSFTFFLCCLPTSKWTCSLIHSYYSLKCAFLLHMAAKIKNLPYDFRIKFKEKTNRNVIALVGFFSLVFIFAESESNNRRHHITKEAFGLTIRLLIFGIVIRNEYMWVMWNSCFNATPISVQITHPSRSYRTRCSMKLSTLKHFFFYYFLHPEMCHGLSTYLLYLSECIRSWVIYYRRYLFDLFQPFHFLLFAPCVIDVFSLLKKRKISGTIW